MIKHVQDPHISVPESFNGVRFELTGDPVELQLGEQTVAMTRIANPLETENLEAIGLHIPALGNYALFRTVTKILPHVETKLGLLSLDAWNILKKEPRTLGLPDLSVLNRTDIESTNYGYGIRKKANPVLHIKSEGTRLSAVFDITHVGASLAQARKDSRIIVQPLTVISTSDSSN